MNPMQAPNTGVGGKDIAAQNLPEKLHKHCNHSARLMIALQLVFNRLGIPKHQADKVIEDARLGDFSRLKKGMKI